MWKIALYLYIYTKTKRDGWINTALSLTVYSMKFGERIDVRQPESHADSATKFRGCNCARMYMNG